MLLTVRSVIELDGVWSNFSDDPVGAKEAIFLGVDVAADELRILHVHPVLGLIHDW